MVLRIRPSYSQLLHLRGSHPVSLPFPEHSVHRCLPDRGPTTPTAEALGLGSSAFARHYSQNRFLFLGLLRCFSSPGSLPLRGSASSSRWVSPFGHRWLLRLHTTRQRFSQCTTSFFGTQRPGIPRVPLSAFLLCDLEKSIRSRYASTSCFAC